ncbi:MAG: hypothetical protein KGN78_14915, partial [Actinomycetales bacterium]|nr:hypothetical protein [Actinomycetales bacterium]
VIGIVIGSMEKAREEEAVANRNLAGSGEQAERLVLLDQLAAVREQLEVIESGLQALSDHANAPKRSRNT